MHLSCLFGASAVSSVVLVALQAHAQTLPATPAQPPMFVTTKVEGTNNVYVFRYQNHQSMFVVTPAGVIATDPISYGPGRRPQKPIWKRSARLPRRRSNI